MCPAWWLVGVSREPWSRNQLRPVKERGPFRCSLLIVTFPELQPAVWPQTVSVLGRLDKTALLDPDRLADIGKGHFHVSRDSD